MRLNSFIARCGYCSRRKADCLVKEGKVKINGKTVRKPFVTVGKDSLVEVEGNLLKIQDFSYLVIDKPIGVTTTLRDRFAAITIPDILPKSITKRLFPAGRLDKNSSGLLIVTNDGELCHRLTHPSFGVEKEYFLKVKGEFSARVCRKAVEGVRDKEDFLKVESINLLGRKKSFSYCRVMVIEGKNRHLRRLFKKLGFEVRELRRERIGGLTLGFLKGKKFRVMGRKAMYDLLFPRSRSSQDIISR